MKGPDRIDQAHGGIRGLVLVVAGNSGKPLLQKLGIKQGQKLAVLNPPLGYEIHLGRMPKGVTLAQELTGGLDLIQLFANDRATLEREFPGLRERIKQDGMIWVSWPKSSSKLRTDLNENVMRNLGLKNGLVDMKICSVDETWSALKFVVRVKNRL